MNIYVILLVFWMIVFWVYVFTSKKAHKSDLAKVIKMLSEDVGATSRAYQAGLEDGERATKAKHEIDWMSCPNSLGDDHV